MFNSTSSSSAVRLSLLSASDGKFSSEKITESFWILSLESSVSMRGACFSLLPEKELNRPWETKKQDWTYFYYKADVYHIDID